MTKAIEQLIRIHDPQCVSIESLNVGKGLSALSREQILGSFAAAQLHHSIGYDTLLFKYRGDFNAGERVKQAITNWARMNSDMAFREESCLLALNLVTQLPLPNQISRSAVLMRRYSSKSNQYHRNISALHEQIKNEETHYSFDVMRIEELKAMLKMEKSNFKRWSEKEASKTAVCQKCSGTGSLSKPQYRLCPECNGSGKVLPTINDIRPSLRIIGAVITEQEYNSDYLPLITNCIQWLFAEASDAERFISLRIKSEVDSAQYVDPTVIAR